MARLVKKIIYTGQIQLITGLHIGSNKTMSIGGPDKFIVRNPLNNIPYIPGSSLKGKMRSLCELYNGETSLRGDVSSDPYSNAGSLFGTSADNDKGHSSRLIVRDAQLDISDKEQFANTELPYSETKTEASINRITSKAVPRTFERVPAGARFNFEMVLNIFDEDDEEKLKKTLRQAMDLLQDDYLGGNGSRGYGKIKFLEVKEDEKQDY